MIKKLINFTEPQIERIEKEQIQTRLTMSDIVRRAIDSYLPARIQVTDLICDCNCYPHLAGCRYWTLNPREIKP